MNNSSILPIPYEFSLFRHSFLPDRAFEEKNSKYLFTDLRKIVVYNLVMAVGSLEINPEKRNCSIYIRTYAHIKTYI